MLKQLNVRNFALISEASLDFSVGYTVITGETGSGKSILLHAINLLLGERADYKVIGNQGEKAVVEALFSIQQDVFQLFFEEHDLDLDQEIIVRREITKQGRSRAFINDVPVQLNVLRDFTERLLTIHSQYNTLELKNRDFQFETLDLLAGTTPLFLTYKNQYDELKNLVKRLSALKEELEQVQKDKDYNDFQLKELEDLNLEKNNFQEIEGKLSKIENQDEVKGLLSQLAQGLGSEAGLIDNLQSLKSVAQRLTKLDSNKNTIEDRISSTLIELKDLEEELTSLLNDDENIDEEQRLQFTELMDKYNRALSKHRLLDANELIQLYHSLQNFAANSDQLAGTIEQLEKDYKKQNDAIILAAKELHAARLKAIPAIQNKIVQSLAELKLPDTTLEFNLSEEDKVGVFGLGNLSILFSANKGIPPVAIEKAASGGELSRVMLALQQLISEKIKLPTIFFDEIDTGVSGDVAQKIGNLLRQMGQTMQLFAISHLPQVAAKASQHLKVEKGLDGESVTTKIRRLSEQERVQEIARLMSGETINDAAMKNAVELMK